MGNISSNKWVLILGIDAAGKTSLLYKVGMGEIKTTMPTIGWTVDETQYNNISISAFDVGYSRAMYPLFVHYISNVKGLIWIVDSNDRDRIDNKNGYELSSCSELHYLLNYFRNEFNNCPILIFANKQDLPNVMDIDEIQNRLNMTKYIMHITPDILASIGTNTYLDMLPINIIHILCEYSRDSICSPQGPMIIEHDLSYVGMMSCDLLKYENDDGILKYKQRNVQKTIHRIICAYLPPYDCWKENEYTECNIFGCSVVNGDGLNEGLQWLSDVLETKQKQCILL